MYIKKIVKNSKKLLQIIGENVIINLVTDVNSFKDKCEIENERDGNMNLSFKTKYSFGVGALGKDLVYAIVSSYLMIYLTDLVGISPLFVGNLFLVARVWDAFNDPMMGMIVDNTRSKYGKFRPWILLGTLVNAVVLIFLFKSQN